LKKLKKQLGQILTDAGKLTEAQLQEALDYKQEKNVYLGQAIIQKGFITEQVMAETLSTQLAIPMLNIMDFELDENILDEIEESFARAHHLIPLFKMDHSLTVAISDPMDIDAIDNMNLDTGLDINLVMSTESEIDQAIDLYYSASRYKIEKEMDTGDLIDTKVVSREIDEDTQIVEAVNMLLDEAIRMGASDIHVEPRKKDVRIRFRVDGFLQQHYTIPKAAMAAMISRLKVISGMDIAESRLPQDGRFSHENRNIKVDLRVSAYPTQLGEKIVLRILDESRSKIELHKLGFDDEMLTKWRKAINAPNGIILVTGPTGSGKTTTLYSTLNVVNSTSVNIMTIEDPIEYKLENVIQSQVNNKAGLTFSVALRAMLRQDPDIILVGEMRDVETVDLALRSALTGHLVFSTLHTNDASSSFTRLLDMDADAYLVSSSIRAIIAQRLIRVLCPRCKIDLKADDGIKRLLKLPKDFKGILKKPVGCVHCKNSGYFGRNGIFELLIPDNEIMNLVKNKASTKEIEDNAVKKGMVTIEESAKNMVVEGRTSIEEFTRMTLL